MTSSPLDDARLEFSDNELCRRYFAKFEGVMRHLSEIAATAAPSTERSHVGEIETQIITDYLARLANSLTALSMKYLLAGLVRHRLPANLEIDQTDSGFPVFREIMKLKQDQSEADARLKELPSKKQIKADIVDHLFAKRSIPRGLQFDMSQRLYYEMLRDRPLFLARNPMQLSTLASDKSGTERYLAHWAVYDTQRNFPYVFLMIVECSGRARLSRDDELRERMEAHLIAQSLSGLKLVTIATGFDKDFPTIHPKFLKRIHVGPLYSNRFTHHGDAIQRILAETEGEPDQDWVFCWSVETLFSKDSRRVPRGLFGETLQEIYYLNADDPMVFDAGASDLERAMVLPYRPYQNLVESGLTNLKGIRAYVVGPDGLLLTNG